MKDETVFFVGDQLRIDLLSELKIGRAELYTRSVTGEFERWDCVELELAGFMYAEHPDGRRFALRSVGTPQFLELRFIVPRGVDGRSIGVVRGSTRLVERNIPLSDGVTEITLKPHGADFTLRVSRGPIERLKIAESEAGKAWDEIEREASELRARIDAAEEIIDYYRERDVTPIEELLDSVRSMLDEAEERVGLFVSERARENERIRNLAHGR